ncbi:hypothetical protein [Paraferrimonas sedimenticola]|uniref:Uncharacterized protein n=1 Tax=Paraferrimonas sedimenticola TaxID=375674 RepID=A0AA37RZM7_9GAMM|nr:hypothetical protein [Paraferrimonas sedimenticola]GLP97537.1 hypothetical protein GCM10007895_28440 [Paraferrimonas sedimenticola]
MLRLTRRQWNNVTIIGCVFFIGLFSLMQRFDDSMADAVPVFDDSNALQSVSLGLRQWHLSPQGQWQCVPESTDCQKQGALWAELALLPLVAHPIPDETSQTLVIQTQSGASLQWQWFAQAGVLRSHSDNWYQLPMRYRNLLADSQ